MRRGMATTQLAQKILDLSEKLSQRVGRLKFSDPVAYVYNPLVYASQPYEKYISAYAKNKKKVFFLGMNPGPFGMAQTGVPFGEVAAVRDWMGLEAAVESPKKVHPKRPIEGFECPRSEVSGRRLWGLFSEKYPQAKSFFKEHIVFNFCPLLFVEESGRNRTPDKLPAHEYKKLEAHCDEFLCEVLTLLEPSYLVGVGAYAQKALERNSPWPNARVGRILHPSPASPAANRGWPEQASKQLQELGVW